MKHNKGTGLTSGNEEMSCLKSELMRWAGQPEETPQAPRPTHSITRVGEHSRPVLVHSVPCIPKRKKPAPAQDIKRSCLFSGRDIIVQVSLPFTPVLRTSAHVGCDYHETTKGVKGGSILYFFYGLPEGAIAGTKVNAKVDVYLRVHPSGEKKIYANFQVIGDQVLKPEHKFVIHDRRNQFVEKPETVFHEHIPDTDGVVEIRTLLEKERPKQSSA